MISCMYAEVSIACLTKPCSRYHALEIHSHIYSAVSMHAQLCLSFHSHLSWVAISTFRKSVGLHSLSTPKIVRTCTSTSSVLPLLHQHVGRRDRVSDTTHISRALAAKLGSCGNTAHTTTSPTIVPAPTAPRFAACIRLPRRLPLCPLTLCLAVRVGSHYWSMLYWLAMLYPRRKAGALRASIDEEYGCVCAVDLARWWGPASWL